MGTPAASIFWWSSKTWQSRWYFSFMAWAFSG